MIHTVFPRFSGKGSGKSLQAALDNLAANGRLTKVTAVGVTDEGESYTAYSQKNLITARKQNTVPFLPPPIVTEALSKMKLPWF